MRNLSGLYQFKSDYFDVGEVVITAGVREIVGTSFEAGKCIVELIFRYCAKDWGDLCEDDCRLNEESIANDGINTSIFACYKTKYGKINISTNRISEDGEFGTTVFLPSER